MKDFFWKIIRPNSSFVGPEGSLSSGVNNARVRQFFGFWFVMQPHNKNKATHTQLTTPLQQRRIQVVRSNKVARKRLTESNGTPAMDSGHMNVGWSECIYIGSVLRIWDFVLKWLICTWNWIRDCILLVVFLLFVCFVFPCFVCWAGVVLLYSL